jgi:Domain of unknown function (DUF4359)
MKGWQIISALGIVGIGALFAATNPPPSAFETFAIDQVKVELCPKVPLGLAKDCPRFVDENQPPLREWIGKNTQQQNYGLFSRYETSLSVRELVPEGLRPALALMPLPGTYRLSAIGVMGRFIIYRTQSK